MLTPPEIPAGTRELFVEVSGEKTAAGADPSILTVDRPPFPFSFLLRDISSRYPIYVPEAQCIILPADDPRDYESALRDIHAGGRRSDFQRMEAEPEESYEHACRENRDQVCPVWLGLGRDLRIFQVSAKEDTGMWGLVVPVFHSKYQLVKDRDRVCSIMAEHPELPNTLKREIGFDIGPGSQCRPRLTRRLDNGVLPILHAVQYEGEVEYRLTIFASLEKSPVTEARVRGSDPVAALSQMNYAMLSERDKAQLRDLLPGETSGREEELVLFVRVEAVNVGSAPQYAWFRAPHTADSGKFRDGMCFEDGKVFADVMLDGIPASDAEYAVLVTPEKPVVWECRIFHSPVSPERGRKLFDQDFQAHLEHIRAYWQGKLDSAAKIEVPEKAIDERIRAGLLHLDLNTIGLRESGPLLPAVGWYAPIGTESAPMVLFFDTMGWHKTAERCIDFFLSRRTPEGFIQVYNNYESETGPVLWMAAEHYRVTRDVAWLKHVTPALEQCCGYLLEWRDANKREEFRAAGSYGLLNGKVADPEDFYHTYFLNAGTLLGLAGMADVLRESDPEYAARLATEVTEYRADLRNSLEHARRRAPVIPLADGSWTPTLPPWAEYSGNVAFFADGGEWFSHGTFACRGSLIGALAFALTDLYAPNDSMMTTLLRSNQHPLTRENAASSQPYYSRHDIAHLRRGEVKLFLKAFYNQFTALQDRQSYTFWEHYHHLSQHKTHEEGWFLMQCRWMLAYEEGETLELFRCIPRRWMENGKRIVIRGLATRFGRLDAELASANGSLEASVRVDRAPRKIVVRMPHPEEKRPVHISSGVYDPATEEITVSGGNSFRIRIEF